MNGGNFENEDDIIDGINVTPLVDVTLVLLIIFMVTANYINQKSIDIKLPKATISSTTPSSELSVVLTKQGQIFLNGKISTKPGIKEFIEKNKNNNAGLQAIISADEHVQHGKVISIIDFIRSQGVENFAISVETDMVELNKDLLKKDTKSDIYK